MKIRISQHTTKAGLTQKLWKLLHAIYLILRPIVKKSFTDKRIKEAGVKNHVNFSAILQNGLREYLEQ